MSTDNLQTFAAREPHVAYVLLWYPLFTQPFIFREVEELRKRIPLSIYTLYGKNLRHCSTEMRELATETVPYGSRSLPVIFAEIFRQFFKNPRQSWKLLKRSLKRRWPDMETLGENLWAFCVGLHLGRRFREEGIDMVYAPWPRGAATAAWVGATLAGIPFALAARGDNLDPPDPDLGDKFSAAAFIRANNDADRQRIESFAHGQAKGKTVLLYNSLTLPEAPEVKRTIHSPLRILALGRFDVTKGFDRLLKACAILKKKNFPFRLTLAGGGGKVMGLGKMGDTLLKLRQDLDLEQEVKMPGLVSHDELPGILLEHDVFAAPCVVHSSGRRDGIPNTVIEAMAYGMPVVSTTVNALPEIVIDGETGLTVPPNAPEALADALLRIGDDPELAIRMGKNARALASSVFDPKLNADRLADIFRKWMPERNWQKKS